MAERPKSDCFNKSKQRPNVNTLYSEFDWTIFFLHSSWRSQYYKTLNGNTNFWKSPTAFFLITRFSFLEMNGLDVVAVRRKYFFNFQYGKEGKGLRLEFRLKRIGKELQPCFCPIFVDLQSSLAPASWPLRLLKRFTVLTKLKQVKTECWRLALF